MRQAAARLLLAGLLAAWAAACDPSATGTGPGGPVAPGPDTTFPTTDGVGFDDTSGADDADEGPGADTGPCQVGAPCDDGDPCTNNDQCVAGTCQGTPLPCDDGLPCTEDSCVQGACQNAIAPGFCKIDDACWSAEQANPVNGCERCDPTKQTLQWSNNDGFPCDDGDPCTDDACQGGICVGTPKVCEDDGNPCTDVTCIGGACEATPIDGGTCDDGDPCTEGDACVEGACVSETAGCDDGLSCTADACTPAGCEHTPKPSFCVIDGACLGNGHANPEDPCQRCDPDVDPFAWAEAADGTPCGDGDSCSGPYLCQDGVCSGMSSECPDDGNPCTLNTCAGGGGCEVQVLDGEPCDDGDPCTTGEACQADVCGGGQPVTGDPACEDTSPKVGTPCTYHTDCYPETLCARWTTTGQKVCSAPCAGSSDCPAGQICSKLPGSANVGFCHGAPPGQGVGSACTEDEQCRTALCTDGVCADLCLNEDHCAGASQTCHPVGDWNAGRLGGACSANPSGYKTFGQVCSGDGGYGGQVCASGHCDIMSLNEYTYLCSNLCMTKADCLAGQECNVVLYGPVPNADSVRFDAAAVVPPQTYDAITACYTPPNGVGSAFDGETCTHPDQCQSRKCLPLIPKSQPDSDQMFCTRLCSTDNDCNSGMVCKTELLNLASSWLQLDPFINGSQDPNLEGWTIVRVCKFE